MKCLRRKVAGWNPDKVIVFLSIYLILPATIISNRNEYQELLWGINCSRHVKPTAMQESRHLSTLLGELYSYCRTVLTASVV
jgi:hypothetical protein